MWQLFKQDFVERFLNFETVKGIYLLPAGGITIWCTLYFFQHVLQLTFLLAGSYFIVEGLRKVFVNRIKQAARVEHLTMKRLETEDARP